MVATDGETVRGEGKQNAFNMTCGKKRLNPKVGGVSVRSRNGAPSQKGCVVNGQRIKASNN